MSSDQMPMFNLQVHHSKVEVPDAFDLRDLAKKYLLFPLKIVVQNGRRKLLLAMVNPFDHQAITDVEFRSGTSVVPVQADRVDIHWLIQVHYFGRKLSPVPHEDDEAVTQDLFAQLELSSDAQSRPEWAEPSVIRYQIEKKS